MLGADDDGTRAAVRDAARDELLELAGRHHAALGPLAGDEAGAARPLADAGRQHDRARTQAHVAVIGIDDVDFRPRPHGDNRGARRDSDDRGVERIDEPARETRGPSPGGANIPQPKPGWLQKRGRPPGASSRSTTSTDGAPPSASARAAASPRGARADDDDRGIEARHASRPSRSASKIACTRAPAMERLAAAEHRARPAFQRLERARRQGRGHRGADLAQRRAFAMADDLAIRAAPSHPHPARGAHRSRTGWARVRA